MYWINQYQFFILLGLFFAGAMISGWLLFDLRKKVAFIFGGKEVKKGGEFWQEVLKRLATSEGAIKELLPRLETLEKISHPSIQKVGFLRYNPFQDTGGDQSFILVILDRDNNGVLVSSLYAREGMRLFAKNIERGKSKHPLSEEEKKVLEETLKKNV